MVVCGIRFLAKKYMDLFNLRIISRFFFFCSSACLAAPAHCISMTFCCSTCLAILAVIDKSWWHLDTLCCFSCSVAWFQSTIPLVVHPPFALGGGLPYFLQRVQNMPTSGSSYWDKLSPKLSCNISSSVVQIIHSPMTQGQGEGMVTLYTMNQVPGCSPLTDMGFVWVFCSKDSGVFVILSLSLTVPFPSFQVVGIFFFFLIPWDFGEFHGACWSG